MKKFDIVIVGAGSGGIGAVWSAAKCGAKVLLVEKNPIIGGTFTSAGVSCWEASISGTGLSEIIYKNAEKYKNATDIYPHLWKKKNYDLTLKVNGLDLHNRIGKEIIGRYGIIIEPEIYAEVTMRLLSTMTDCEIKCNSRLTKVITDDRRIKSVEINTAGKREQLEADFFIDATGNIILADMAGCELVIGAENRHVYNEDFAPEINMPDRINGASLIFRITADLKRILSRPKWTLKRGKQRPPMSPHLQRFANGEWLINPLLTFTGKELEGVSEAEIYEEGLCRTWDIWDEIRNKYRQFSNFGICWIAPELGIREGKRIVSEYVLTQNDIEDGLGNHKYEDVIAVADHMFDMHGVTLKKIQLLEKPYGIPFRSLIPKGWNNLLVACRGAGFSHLAASSCRLSRTIMQLGQAAGTAAALAANKHISLMNMDYGLLRNCLENQGIVLDKAVLEDRYRLALEQSGAQEIIDMNTKVKAVPC